MFTSAATFSWSFRATYDDAVGVYVTGDSSIYIGGNAIVIANSDLRHCRPRTVRRRRPGHPPSARTAAPLWTCRATSTRAARSTLLTGVYNHVNARLFVDLRGRQGRSQGVFWGIRLTGVCTPIVGETGEAYVHVDGGRSPRSPTSGMRPACPSIGVLRHLRPCRREASSPEAYGTAIGVEAIGYFYAEVTVGGNVTAIALEGDAYGVPATPSDDRRHRGRRNRLRIGGRREHLGQRHRRRGRGRASTAGLASPSTATSSLLGSNGKASGVVVEVNRGL